MSRSIHDTWGVLRRTRREDFSNLEEKLERIRALRSNIADQRSLKAQTRNQRRLRGLTPAQVDPQQIPIIVSDESTYIHHSATEEDIRAVLLRLPPGMLDGLSVIYLCRSDWPPERDAEVDPFTGTPATELTPSVFLPRVSGECAYGGGSLCVFAHIHPPEAPGVHAVYLTLRALSTLVHECSHHFDDTSRGERDRWHKGHRRRNEAYVRARSLELVETCVVPYLEESRPAECRALAAWMERHGGLALPLALLTDDRDASRYFAEYAYQKLARGVAAGADPAELRKSFGSTLLYGGHHKEALLVFERALAERPADGEMMRYLALACVEAGRIEEAETLFRRVCELAPEAPDTWLLEARLHQRSARWADQARSAERALTLSEEEARRRSALAYRADAWLGLDRWEELSTDIAALRAFGSDVAQVEADTLELRMLCRTGRWKEGLTSALRLLRSGAGSFEDDAFAEAVRFECAHRLGRRSAAGKLSERTIALLRSAGQGAWVDRLASERQVE